jgi:hypothetical protein
MYKILLLFSSFYSLSLSLSSPPRGNKTAGDGRRKRERTLGGGKNNSKTYGRRKRTRLSLFRVEK